MGSRQLLARSCLLQGLIFKERRQITFVAMSIRVKLDLGTFGHQKLQWTLIDPARTPTIEDLAAQLSARRGLGPNIEILLDGCLLPGDESVAILQSGDVITVIRKEDSLAAGESQDTRYSVIMATGTDKTAFAAFKDMEKGGQSKPKGEQQKRPPKGPGPQRGEPDHGLGGKAPPDLSSKLDDISGKLTHVVNHMSSISQSLDGMSRRLTTLEQRAEDVERFIAEQRSLRVTVGPAPNVAKSFGAKPIM